MNTNFGFVRVAAAVPTMRVADCHYNAEQVRLQIDEAIEQGVEVICFPELTMTGYTCADLFFTQALQQSSMRELEALCDYTRGKAIIVLVGAPLQVDNDLFNCAFVMSDGEVMGVVPKVNLPNTGEFYDLMPKHIVMNPIMTAMKNVDAERTDKFARGWLKWTT